MKNPCTVDCNKRNPTCHIECEEYKEWKAQDKELKEKMREDSIEMLYPAPTLGITLSGKKEGGREVKPTTIMKQLSQQEQEVLAEAINKFGRHTQEVLAIQEMSELIKVITDGMRGKPDIEHMAEEIADVVIMCHQLCLIHNIGNSSIGKYAKRKLDRLKERAESKDYSEYRWIRERD